MRIGITGHQRLNDLTAWSWVEEIVGRELDAAPPPLVVVSSLAIGADQLVARLALARNGAVYAVLPFEDLERTFSPEDLPGFKSLLSRSQAEVLRGPGSDEDAYLAAGKRVVDLSDMMMAVWDGQHAQGRGGTADIVAYARSRGAPLIHINPETRAVVRFLG